MVPSRRRGPLHGPAAAPLPRGVPPRTALPTVSCRIYPCLSRAVHCRVAARERAPRPSLARAAAGAGDLRGLAACRPPSCEHRGRAAAARVDPGLRADDVGGDGRDRGARRSVASAMSPALVVLLAFLLLSLLLGVLARRGHAMNLEQWTVGGRGFGTLFVFLLMAGEIYTTFTFLGASGWAYGRGAPAFYILCYGALAYSLSYFLLPVIWRYGIEHRLHSQADFFAHKYGSRSLGVVVSLVGVAAIVPYLVLQLKGLGIIVSETSYGRLSVAQAVWISVGALVAYVMASGVRGSAWTAVVKDVMILVVAVALGIYLPIHYYGSPAAMFAAIE